MARCPQWARTAPRWVPTAASCWTAQACQSCASAVMQSTLPTSKPSPDVASLYSQVSLKEPSQHPVSMRRGGKGGVGEDRLQARTAGKGRGLPLLQQKGHCSGFMQPDAKSLLAAVLAPLC